MVLLVGASTATASRQVMSLYRAGQITESDERARASSLVDGETRLRLLPECTAKGLYKATCQAVVAGRMTEFDQGTTTYLYEECKWRVKVQSTGRYPYYQTKHTQPVCRSWTSTSPLEWPVA